MSNGKLHISCKLNFGFGWIGDSYRKGVSDSSGRDDEFEIHLKDLISFVLLALVKEKISVLLNT